MNVITCGALLCLHVNAISRDKRIVFAACFVLSTTGMETHDCVLCSAGETIGLFRSFLCNRFLGVFKNDNVTQDLEQNEKPGKILQSGSL